MIYVCSIRQIIWLFEVMEVQDIFSVLQHHRLCYQFGYTKYTSWYYMGDMMSLISYKSYHVTHIIWFRWNEYNTDWLWQSSNQFFGNHYQNKCTNKHRFRRVAWKGQFLVNKPIGQNYCFNSREGYSHYQERYNDSFHHFYENHCIMMTSN